MHYEENGMLRPCYMTFVLTNLTNKSMFKSKENPAILRKAEKDVYVSHNWSSSVLLNVGLGPNIDKHFNFLIRPGVSFSHPSL